MCGIIGYLGSSDVQPVILRGLKRLEYRGYDSAGVAIFGNGELGIKKRAGKIEKLEKSLREDPIEGTMGIGHTRWATHGPPTTENAHPHQDCNGSLALVHNGIIENYRQLRSELQTKGHKFASETDTEVLAHLIEDQEGSLEDRVREALQSVKGTFAIAVMSVDDPVKIVGARRGSPLVIGLPPKTDEKVIASDVPALLDITREVVFLEDDDVVAIEFDRVTVTDLNGEVVNRESRHIDWDPVSAQKEGYKHFMLKEIHEQSQAVSDTLRGRVSLNFQKPIKLDEGEWDRDRIENLDRVYIVACGTSSYAGQVAKYLWEDFLDLPVEVELGSEFRYRNPPISPQTLVVGISQSGETADTLAGLEKAREKGAYVLAIPNVLGSTITRRSDGVLYTHAGPEIGVASTKAFTSQLAALVLLGLQLGRLRGTVDRDRNIAVQEELSRAPNLLRKVLAKEEEIIRLAEEFYPKDNFLFLGRDVLYPIALEGALKLKEISYIHAEGYASGEMKHGPIALIDEDMPVVALITKNCVYDKVFSNIEEVKARKGTVLMITDSLTEEIESVADRVLVLPATEKILTPLLFVVPLQLLAYHIGVLRGTDVDQPRNLAKSVTVE